MRRYLLICLILCMATGLAAQVLKVNVPRHVEVGEQFRLQYTLNTSNASGFREGNIPDAFEVLFGPSMSSQSNWQMVNGHTSSSSSVTYTFLLSANKKGTFTIPPAHVRIGGRTVASPAVKIVVTGNGHANGGGGSRQQAAEPRMRAAGSHISGNDLFIKVSANKKRVHEQEPVLLTYKVYTQVDLTQLEGKMPDLTGFHTQEVKLPQQKSFHLERVNGRNYRCVTWSQYVMYPQMTGTLKIPSIVFKGIVVQENRNIDPFEAFFNGGSGYVEVKKNITAPGLTIQVDPLPKRPANFSGGVGKFNISAQIDKKELKTGDPITVRVVVGGIGNLKLIKQPVVNFPKDFEKYDAKVTDKTRLTANGVEGNMVYDFLAVPNNQGSYTIPPVEFTYYDTGINQYKTLKTQAFDVKVDKGNGRSSVDNFGSDKDKDIHPLKKGKVHLHERGDFFFGSAAYWTWLAVLVMVFVALLIVFRKRAMERANVSKQKTKRANKVATKRLKKASVLMFKGDHDAFYDEVLHALWGYVGDKLNMPIETLTRDNISERLASKDVDEETINKFISALDECEFERYAPGDVKGNMNKTFESAMTAIMKIEDVMKANKKKGGKTLLVLLILLVASLTPISAGAITKKNADAEYVKGNYQQAIKDYEELLKGGESAALYYNLGNAYYRSDNITRAVLNYERALVLSPGDNDIRFNLQMARSKTIDKITPESEMFFVTWYHALVNMKSVDGWAYTAVWCMLLASIMVLLYLFANRLSLRKIGFFSAIVFVVIFVLSNVFAFQQKYQIEHRTGAIIVSPSVTVKQTPLVTGKDAFTIHEGTKVEITDKSIKNWYGVRLADGREGWIQGKSVEII